MEYAWLLPRRGGPRGVASKGREWYPDDGGTVATAITFDEQLVTRNYLDERLKELEYRLVLRLGGMVVVAIGVMATLVKLL